MTQDNDTRRQDVGEAPGDETAEYVNLPDAEVVAWLDMQHRKALASGDTWSYEGVAAEKLRALASSPPAPGGDAVRIAAREAVEILAHGHGVERIAFAIKLLTDALAAAPAPAVGREAWTCIACDQRNAGWANVCGRCDLPSREHTTPPAEARGPVGDATLWALHIEGPDDVHPAPSREMAQEAADLFNSTFPQSDNPNWPRAVAKVIEWPHGSRAHALEAPSFAEYWLLSKTTREAPRPCGLTLMLACPLPDGHSGRCEYLPPHVRRIADEMEAWSEKKMIGPNSSRIDRTVVREWARQLRGEE